MKPKNFARYASMARRMRRTAPVAIEHSGGRQTIYGCLCGARHTCATNYRQAVHVQEFCYDHNESCWPLFERRLAARRPGWLDARRADIYNNDNH